VHPVLSDRRRSLAYAALSVPVAVAVAAILTRPPDPLAASLAAGLALPLALGLLALLLPAWYLCRTLPVGESTLPRLVATQGAAALATSLLWVYAGAQAARLLAATLPAADLPRLYRAHVTALLAEGSVLYLLSASFYYVTLAVEARRRAEKQTLELAVLAREAELKALKAQVHPHFLFNSLNSISALTASDPARAREMCILLAEFFRKSLALGERPSVSLEEELAVARTYLAIEGMRFGARLAVEEKVDAAGRACRLPPLLLQPLVENAIRHGIATRSEGGVLRLEASTDGERLRLLVENPFDPESPSRKGVGLGLANVRQRLHARYGEKARLDAERATDYFRVTVLLPAEVEA
jgi:two-component system, LytTR family, sensor histidine kinase AlgZ